MEETYKSIAPKLSRVFLKRTYIEEEVYDILPREDDDGEFADVFYEPREQIDYPPTEALPGSFDKLEVLKERATRFLPLFHPLDNRGLQKRLEEEICDGFLLRSAR